MVNGGKTAGLMLAAVAAACGGGPSPAAGPEPQHSAAMFRLVLTELTSESLPDEGDWPDDFGDANHFGAGFFFRYGAAADNSAQLALARETHAHNSALIDETIEVPVTFLQVPDEVLMAGFGLIEAYAHDADPATGQRIEELLDLVDILVEPFDYYPDSFEIIYGPTTINAALALLNLEYAIADREVNGGAGADARIATAELIIAAGRATAYSDELGYYRYLPDEDRLYLYPNVMQILAHARAYELTGSSHYLERARALHAAIQPLKVDGEGRYRSPYSAAVMGATSDDYTTLSSQNYTMLALAVLYELTGDEAYRQEVIAILDFIASHLLAGGRVLHHWIDGEIARPSDAEYYCTGCNLQLLYLIWRLEDMFASPM